MVNLGPAGGLRFLCDFMMKYSPSAIEITLGKIASRQSVFSGITLISHAKVHLLARAEI